MARWRVNQKNLLLSFQVMEANLAYQEAYNQTDAGQRSLELREAGIRLAREGREAQALERFHAAALLFTPDDQSEAAGATLYDLAESLSKNSEGKEREFLLEARRLLKRVVAMESRKRDVLRYALTVDKLARVERTLLLEGLAVKGRTRDQQMGHIEQLHLEACAVSERAGPVGWLAGSQYLTNFGNTLQAFGKHDAAVEIHQHAVQLHAAYLESDLPEAIRQFARVHAGPKQQQPPELNLASALLERGTDADLARALPLAKSLLKRTGPPFQQRARLLALRILVRLDSPSSREQAHKLAADVSIHSLDSSSLVQHARVFESLGLTDRAIEAADLATDQLMQRRTQAIGNHVAAELARMAGQSAAFSARLKAHRGDAVEAFLTLEAASGLGYFDEVSRYAAGTKDPVATHIQEAAGLWGERAMRLEELAGRLPRAEEPRAALALMIAVLEKVTALNHALPLRKKLLDEPLVAALREAQASSSPVSVLRAAAERARDEALRLRAEFEAVDPNVQHLRQRHGEPPTELTLHQLFAEYPKHLLSRLVLSPEVVLCFSVWSEADTLRGHAAEVPLSADVARGLEVMLASVEGGQHEVGALDRLLEVLAPTRLWPDLPGHTLVLLPSLLAALVPWAAVGTPGNRLLDRFDSLIQLPSLTPMVMRQFQSVPRAGQLTVVPNGAGEAKPTQFHDVAFRQLGTGEVLLSDLAATVDAVDTAASTADVVAFYTHGMMGDVEVGSLQLAEGKLDGVALERGFKGCERVELWACQTGVNIPTDDLTPRGVDDGYGLDIAFHKAGVRSTIGTMWQVPDLVTGVLVREYRLMLASGRLAHQALADAQRWWQREGLEDVRRVLAAVPEVEGIAGVARALSKSLGCTVSVDGLAQTLGPMRADETMTAAQIDGLVAELSDPTAWAGFRFVGVCDRRPLHTRERTLPELDEAQQTTLDFIVGGGSVQMKADPNDRGAVGPALTASYAAVETKAPSTNECIRAARLEQVRFGGSRAHDLVRSAAWLHEGLAAEGLSTDDRARLATEAAWVWLELAFGESGHPLFEAVLWRHRLLVRLQAVLPEVAPEDAELLAHWEGVLDASKAEQASVFEVSAALLEQLDRWVGPVTDHSGVRRACWAAERMLLASPNTEVACEPAQRWLEKALTTVYPRLDLQTADDLASCTWVDRLLLRVAELRLRTGSEPTHVPRNGLLPPADLPRLARVSQQLAERLPESRRADALFDVLNDAINDLERDYWGHHRGGGSTGLTSTGTPGRAWNRLVGGYMMHKVVHGAENDTVPHVLANLHLRADLRVGQQAALCRYAAGQLLEYDPFRDLAAGIQRSKLLADELLAVALDADMDLAGRMWRRVPDAFVHPGTAIIDADHLSADHQLQWDLAYATRPDTHELERRTAAFGAAVDQQGVAQGAVALRKELESALSKTRAKLATETNVGPIEALVDAVESTSHVLEDILSAIRHLPENVCVLGLFEDALGNLALVAQAGGTHGARRMWAGTERDALRLRFLLSELYSGMRGGQPSDNARSDAWKEVEALLRPALDAVLPDATTEARYLQVLAPGRFRGLPWAMLDTHAGRLCKRFDAVVSIPHLGFGRAAVWQRSDARSSIVASITAGAPTDDPIGHAVVHAAHHGPVAWTSYGPTGPVHPRALPELERLKADGARLQRLVVFPLIRNHNTHPAIHGFPVSASRGITTRNLFDLALPKCEVVELWGGRMNMGEFTDVQMGHRDALPPLVSTFLASGALCVVDLAWAVHPVVRALVFEQYQALMERGTSPQPALADALQTVRTIQGLFRADPSVPALDDYRARLLAKRGRAPESVPSFRSLGFQIASEAEMLDFCDPVHLAAFRCWSA